MEAFKEWEKTIPCADGCPDCGATGDEAAWRAALKWALSKATHGRVECNVIEDELEEVE